MAGAAIIFQSMLCPLLCNKNFAYFGKLCQFSNPNQTGTWDVFSLLNASFRHLKLGILKKYFKKRGNLL